MERGASLYNVERDAKNVVGQMYELVGCLFYQSRASWFLGYPTTAAELSGKMVAHARSLKHHHSLTVALLFSSFLHLLEGAPAGARVEGEEALQLSIERGIPQWGPMSQVQVGAAMAMEGDPTAGLELIDEGLGTWSRLGSRLVKTWLLAWKAEALRLSGRAAEASATVQEALNMVEEIGERLYEAELYRLQGEIELVSDAGAAERAFRRAVEIARELGAKSLELRAATSLARVLAENGRQSEARAELGGVVGWFTEGFETRDLRAASALLKEL
jgi:tetratricopeptide (TPR) repeat protein